MTGPTLSNLGKFGWIPEKPKSSDYLFKSTLKTEIPQLASKLKLIHSGDVDLSQHITNTNQYKANTCAGCATADSVEILNSIEGLPNVQLSALFIYTLSLNFMDLDGDGKSDIDKDDGTYISLCFEVLRKFGVCREDIPKSKGGWPYDIDPRTQKPKDLHILPSLLAMRSATGKRIHSYYRINSSNRLDDILTALRSNHPVVFGTQINESFVQLRSGSPVEIPTGPTIGGHAMIIVGYITGKGFIVKNSWGPYWGDRGFCIMKPEYISWTKTQDLWVPTKGVNFR